MMMTTPTFSIPPPAQIFFNYSSSLSKLTSCKLPPSQHRLQQKQRHDLSLNKIMMVTSAPQRTKVSPAPVREVQRETKQPDMYRLYIYNDPINRRERVVDVLLKTCTGLSFSQAYAAMQEAHEHGRGLVLIITQEIAEHYCACINSAGVISTVEPDN